MTKKVTAPYGYAIVNGELVARTHDPYGCACATVEQQPCTGSETEKEDA